MMAIGQALLSNPALLMLDEPSEGLSIFVIQRIEDVCRHLKSRGLAILLVEQDLEMARALADRVYFIDHGRVTYGSDGDSWRNDSAASGTYFKA
jgi:branched-chain amino acid transport system ATP-binding protein